MVTERLSQGPAQGSPRACGLARRMRLAGPWLTMGAALFAGGCFDDPIVPEEQDSPGIVSNPVSSLSAAGSRAIALGATAPASVAYVSLPPDSVPNGELAVIRNVRTRDSARTVMADGGFDPVSVAASVGDALEIAIQVSGGGNPVHMTLVVPGYRKPRVVRTRPIARKRDVVLNARPTIVFSEPIDSRTIGEASVRLLRSGSPVRGRVTLSADGLRAEFQPDQLLAANTAYVLSVTTGVTDLSGDELEQAVEAEFTTGTTTAVAMVYTDPAALYVVTRDGRTDDLPRLIGLLRTMEFSAILHDDGRVTGEYRLFYPEKGWGNAGRISCFTIAGDTAWVGAVIQESAGNPETVGLETGWMAVDHGLPGTGVADQLSLAAVGLEASGFGTAQDFCNDQPTVVREGLLAGQELLMQDVETGDVVVTGVAVARPTGAIHVTTRTTGTPDPDGFEVSVCGDGDSCFLGYHDPVRSDLDVMIPRVKPGSHTVTLLHVVDECTVSGPNPRIVDVSPRDTAEVTFDVACTVLKVLVPYEADGYRFKVLTDSTSSGGAFELSTFDDVGAGFSDGTAAFSNDDSRYDEGEQCPLGSTRKTDWPAYTDLLLRKTFEVPSGVGHIKVRVAIDNDVQVFVNGMDLTASGVPDSLEGGFEGFQGGFQRHGGCAWRDSFVFPVPEGILQVGSNLLAIRARDRGVISYADLRVTAERQ